MRTLALTTCVAIFCSFAGVDMAPAQDATMGCASEHLPNAAQVVWYVDGKPFLVARADETARWPLQAGAHTFEARVPYSDRASKTVTILVE